MCALKILPYFLTSDSESRSVKAAPSIPEEVFIQRQSRSHRFYGCCWQMLLLLHRAWSIPCWKIVSLPLCLLDHLYSELFIICSLSLVTQHIYHLAIKYYEVEGTRFCQIWEMQVKWTDKRCVLKSWEFVVIYSIGMISEWPFHLCPPWKRDFNYCWTTLPCA